MASDTIAAIATAMTNSGIGIVRISGEDALSITDQIFRPKNRSKRFSERKSHTIHYGYIYDGEELVDEVLVLLMKGPNSYTAEDTVEIDCHGGIIVMQKIFKTVVKYGARPAEPGEFTKRAFLNGRIDLSQAEAVIDVIESKNEYALKNSMNQLKGDLHDQIQEIRDKIIYQIAYIESALDDPEHISLDGYPSVLLKEMREVYHRIKKLLKTSGRGKMIKEGINTVIVGKPNAGKSSMLNLLIGEEKAIVTSVAGTTRDVLTEQIQLNGIGLNIIDTAGIRETDDIVEKIGVHKAKEYAMDADLILFMADASVPLDKSDEEIMELIREKIVIVLLNKTDLDMVVKDKYLIEKMREKGMREFYLIPVSARDHRGIDLLEEKIKELFVDGKIDFNDEVFITNERQKASLEEAGQAVLNVCKSIEDDMPEDFFSIDLMAAFTSLGEIIGEEVGDSLIEEIFSKFCMGK